MKPIQFDPEPTTLEELKSVLKPLFTTGRDICVSIELIVKCVLEPVRATPGVNALCQMLDMPTQEQMFLDFVAGNGMVIRGSNKDIVRLWSPIAQPDSLLARTYYSERKQFRQTLSDSLKRYGK